jgi:phenylpyruvate tautomerase PptA (4-oxalocrotonate tautomerase family)
MMVQVVHDESLFFAGSKEPCAMVQIQSIGGNFEPLIAPLSEILISVGGILPSRIFMNFQEFTSDNWSTHGVTVKKFHEHPHSS